MTTTVELTPHNVAVANVLALTGKPIGELEAPDGGGWQAEWGNSDFVPYSVFVLDDTDFAGPIGDPSADAILLYRIVSFGLTPTQAGWMADKVRATLNKVNLVTEGIPNRKVMGSVFTSQGGAQRDDSVQPPLYYVSDTYTLMTTPA